MNVLRDLAAGDGIGEHGPELLPLDAGEQYRFGFAMEACIGCHSCEVACAEQNGLPPGIAWRRVGEIEGGSFPRALRLNVSMSCNHCLEPSCLEGCPTNAYEKLANGVVAHHADDCIGCQYCTWNCPYSAPVFQPDRRIVTKCDLCSPRLDAGLAPACVDACPTRAITVEKVDVVAWRADHTAANGPNLPPASLTISTTRISAPETIPTDTWSTGDWNLRPEDPHWPLVVLTLLTQIAVGTSITATGVGARALAAALALGALTASLFHLGRPLHAVKALRNLRRSWLSREVLLFGAYGACAAAAVVLPSLAVPAAILGLAGVYASGRLYVVPGRPAWNTPLTLVHFFATALATGPLLTGHTAVAVTGIAVQLGATTANLVRLGRDDRLEWWGTTRLTLRRFRPWFVARVVAALIGLACALAGLPVIAFALVVAGESIGRVLFYVTVVPLNIPRGFFR